MARRKVPTRIALLVTVMAVVSLISVAVALYQVYYKGALTGVQSHLEDQVHVYESMLGSSILKLGEERTLELVKGLDNRDADDNVTSEVLIARRSADRVDFLFSHGHSNRVVPESVPYAAMGDTPMARALAGQSGTMIGRDYRGNQVLAAYAPIDGTDWALVAKIDLAEVRSKFIWAGGISAGIAILLVVLGAFLFTRINYPLVAELARSERRYRSLAEATPQLVWTADVNGLGIASNTDWQAFTGQQAFEMAGYGWTKAVHPDDRDRILTAYKKAIATKQSYTVEIRVRRNDGVYRTMIDRGVPVLDESGKVTEWVGTCTDVTDERARGAELARLNTAIEQACESVMITDVQGRIVYVNPAFTAVTGYTAKDAIGKTPKILNSRQHSRDFFRNLWHTILSGQPWRGEVTNRRKDGSLYTEFTVITPVRDARGEIVNFIATRQDVTERHALEDRLRQAQKMEAIGRMAGGVAHDFNNILNVILGYTEMVTDDKRLDPTSRERLAEVLKAGNRAANLTRQLLAFSRKQVLQPCVLNLNNLLTDLNGMLRRVIGEDVELIHCLQPVLGNVFADPGQIEQVVMNLVVNSRDAMPRGGTLTIETADVTLRVPLPLPRIQIPAGRYITLTIADTGSGIPLDAQAHIFEPFFTTKTYGTGLGLATVYGVVKQSGGYILLKSERDKGTSFTIYLPRVEKDVDQLMPDPVRTESLGGSETILLVEDASPLRRMTREVLAAAGYTILEAENGSHAVDVAAQHAGSIHLLITDVVMPMMGGRELAERLPEVRSGIKVLFISGYTDDQCFTLDEGASFLQKPFAPADLLSRVRELLNAPPTTPLETHSNTAINA